MISITTACVTSSAPPAAFFARWADVDTWPQWNGDTEWVRLDGPFVEGGTGTLKPKGGPKVRFVIERLVPGERFTDTSKLIGARLTFDHSVGADSNGTTVHVAITMQGPMAWFWVRVLGKGFRSSAQPDLDALARAAEAA